MDLGRAASEPRQKRLLGFADKIDRRGAAGWAFEPEHPDAPVLLDILDNDEVIAQVVADRFRDGLSQAGIGDGHHSFEIKFAAPLSPLTRHVVRVCRASDRLDLQKSGVVIEPGPEPRPDSADAIKFHIDYPIVAGGRIAQLPEQGDLFIEGWAIADDGVAAIDILLDGAPLGTATHGLPRKGVRDTFPDRPNALHSGFAFSAPERPGEGRHVVSIVIRDTEGLTRSAEFALDVAPRSRGPANWAPRPHVALTELSLKLARLAAAAWQPTFLVMLRLTDATPSCLAAARMTLQSLRRQAYPDWKLALLLPEGAEDCRSALVAGLDERATRTVALIAPTGTENPVFVVPLTEGDALGADALLELALAGVGRPDIEFLYSDERRADPESGVEAPYFKPDWSPELLLSTNYIGRLWAASAALFVRVGAMPQEIVASGEYDLVLRLTEVATAVGHVPQVLCARGPALLDAVEDERHALVHAVARRGIEGELLPGCLPSFHRLKRRVERPGLVSIVMPTAGARGLFREAIASLRKITRYRDIEIVAVENIPADDAGSRQWLAENADTVVSLPGPFNWSRFSNAGARQAKGRFLLFLNDDIEIVEPDWLDALLEHAQRQEVGVVGARLLYPNGTVQHAGMFLGETGGRHGFRFLRHDAPGPFGLALTQRDVIAVTGACLMVRGDTFAALGGFEEAHDVINNDLDFCLRVHRVGLRTVYTPYASLIHHEKASRAALDDSHDEGRFQQDWARMFVAGDPFFNRNLSKSKDGYVPVQEAVEVLFPAQPLTARSDVRRILALKLDHIGDFITAMRALRRLRTHFPQAEITVVAPSASEAIIRLEPAVDRVIPFDLFDARSVAGGDRDPAEIAAAFAELVHANGFDLAIDLRRQPETRFLLRQTGARWLAGFENTGQFPWLDIAVRWEGDVTRAPKQRHVSEDLLSLVDAVNAAFEPAAALPRAPRAKARAALAKLPGITRSLAGWSGQRWAAIHPAAGAENRRWPVQSFAALIDLLAVEEDMRCFLVGGPEDAALAQSVIDVVKEPSAVRSLAGRIVLSDLPLLVQSCDLFVGNNSGPQHLAAALGIPTVNVHSGVIDPHEWGPIGPAAVSVRRATVCSPCYLASIEDCHRDLACLRTLGPRDVLKVCHSLLEKPAINSTKSRRFYAPESVQHQPPRLDAY